MVLYVVLNYVYKDASYSESKFWIPCDKFIGSRAYTRTNRWVKKQIDSQSCFIWLYRSNYSRIADAIRVEYGDVDLACLDPDVVWKIHVEYEEKSFYRGQESRLMMTIGSGVNSWRHEVDVYDCSDRDMLSYVLGYLRNKYDKHEIDEWHYPNGDEHMIEYILSYYRHKEMMRDIDINGSRV